MATYRIGIGTEFKLDAGVGIGTATPGNGLGDLRVEGTIKTADLDVTGVSTFTRYAGFAADNISVNRDTSLTGEHSTIGDIVVGVNSIFTVSTGATVTVGTVESVSIGTHFSPPKGDINDRPEVPVEGTVRFNEDLNTLEFYNGFEWRQFTANAARGRGVFLGGAIPTTGGPSIDFVNISSLGNSSYFGDLLVATAQLAGCSSETRGVAGGGEAPGIVDTIQYITIASEGNAIDFGNLSDARRRIQDCACSSSTRGLFAGGWDGSNTLNTIDYVEIATVGNAVDFGDLIGTRESGACCSSPTRGIYSGGRNQPGNAAFPDIQVFTMASKGNAVKFGDLSVRRFAQGGLSNSTRGIFFNGKNPATVTTMDYITIASEGNASDFGDTIATFQYPAGTANATRGLIVGGNDPSVSYNRIEYVTIATLGDAADFGDMGFIRQEFTAVSDCHGGLGGY